MASKNPDEAAAFEAFTGVNRPGRTPLEWALGLTQNLFAKADNHGTSSTCGYPGQFSFALKPNGYVLNVSGGFFYLMPAPSRPLNTVASRWAGHMRRACSCARRATTWQPWPWSRSWATRSRA